MRLVSLEEMLSKHNMDTLHMLCAAQNCLRLNTCISLRIRIEELVRDRILEILKPWTMPQTGMKNKSQNSLHAE